MGQKFAAYDTNGNIDGFYDSVDSPVPSGVSAIEITDEQWQACLTASIPYTVSNGALVAPTAAQELAQAQALQSGLLKQACQSAITGGFSSSALGLAYNYPSTLSDQSNQGAIAGSSAGGQLWCESGTNWAMQTHTQAQAQAVVASFAAWLNKCQSQLVALKAEVAAATTAAAVEAIVWVAPT